MKALRILIILITSVISACAGHKPVTDGPSIWCNKSYIGSGVFHEDALTIARNGYIYSLASSLALENNPAWFRLGEQDRLVKVDRREHDSTDFLASVFELRNLENHDAIDEVVIAFSGSNSWYDWLAVNLPFGGASDHYEQGRKYTMEISEMYKSRMANPPPIVVTGASLGGGIAVHVTKHDDTKKLVSKAWVFNSSPKTLVNGDLDPKIWAASMEGEILNPLRAFFRVAPGLEGLGITAGHSYNGYNLVQSNAAFSHYNYVLTRNLLHAADYAMKILPGVSDKMKAEPIEIIERSSDRNCQSPKYQMPPEKRW